MWVSSYYFPKQPHHTRKMSRWWNSCKHTRCENALRYFQMHLNSHLNLSLVGSARAACLLTVSLSFFPFPFCLFQFPFVSPCVSARRCTVWTRRMRTPPRWRSSVWTVTPSLRSKRSCSTLCIRAALIHKGQRPPIWTSVRHAAVGLQYMYIPTRCAQVEWRQHTAALNTLFSLRQTTFTNSLWVT